MYYRGAKGTKTCGNSISWKPFFVNSLERDDLVLTQIDYDFRLLTVVSSRVVLMLARPRSLLKKPRFPIQRWTGHKGQFPLSPALPPLLRRPVARPANTPQRRVLWMLTNLGRQITTRFTLIFDRWAIRSKRRLAWQFSFWIVRTLVAVSFVIGLTVSALCASPVPHKKDEKTASSTQRFAVHPNDVILAVAQTQVFGVTDTDGKPVSVRWKISGVGCSISACGTIDSNGNYQAPQSVSHPLVVTLEGIPLSDGEFPTFARIQLAPGIAPPAHSAALAESNAPQQSLVAQEPVVRVSNSLHVSDQGSDSQSTIAATPAADASIATIVTPAASVTPASVTSAAEVPTPRGPKVTYQNGLLAIDATNTTLAEVLRLVAQKTGAIIDIPPGTGFEPIVEHAGPAPAEDVLRQLLKGSRFNFVVIGSPQRPNELQQVLLSLRSDIPGQEVASAPPPEPHVAPAAEPEPVAAAAPPQDPERPHSGPLTRDELREILKERAREIREHPPQTAPPSQ
jgi:hypothetical protein